MFTRTFKPEVIAQPTSRNKALLSLCPTLAAPYSLPLPLCNGHVETIFAAWFRSTPGVTYERELLHMPDGGLVALDARMPQRGETPLPDTAPILLLLPGLTGGSEDSYVQHGVHSAAAAGFRPFVMNMRGTSHMPVKTAQFFSAAYTGDFREVVSHVRRKHPDAMLLAAGWSNGANILTRYLGEEGEATPITAAVAFCNPFNMPKCQVHLCSGFSQLYNWNLARSLRRIYLRHAPLFEEAAAKEGKPYNTAKAATAQTIADFDDAITAVTFGYANAHEYYVAASSDQSVAAVRVPFLVIQAKDDPIAIEAAIPVEDLASNPSVILTLTPTGGHLGWCSGEGGVRGAPWTNTPAMEFFSAITKLAPMDYGKEDHKHDAPQEATTYSLPSETTTKVVHS